MEQKKAPSNMVALNRSFILRLNDDNVLFESIEISRNKKL